MRGRSLILLAALALAACGAGGQSKQQQAPETPIVEIVEAAPLSAAGAVRASGLIGYRREPPLAFTSPGIVATINVDAGDVVHRGQRLATLRRTSVGASAGEAALARENAERELARTQTLFERGFVSQARLDEARLAVERTTDSAAITAPSDGVILRRVAEPAQMIAAGAPVLVLGETRSGLVVRAPVSGGDAARIRTGDTAAVRVSGEADARAGRVTRVGAKGDSGTGAFEVEVEIAATENLRSGMVAEVEIAAAPTAAASAPPIIVPTLSLLDARADQGIVYVVDAENIARRRAVRTAGVTQAGVLIVEGLSPGERVVAAGAAYIRDGETVRIAAAS
ncbi:efflux RND transporter periplasmic adaptor subunit [Terricaulis sp.]|uniref:efflux RND transporter periplasmic adaptor subunit n=1 Tax=Terricaulis sp. TaxID=2768686 RepID=UPI003784853F